MRIALGVADSTEVTCEQCPANGHCEYAFDLYNIDGDCLALK